MKKTQIKSMYPKIEQSTVFFMYLIVLLKNKGDFNRKLSRIVFFSQMAPEPDETSLAKVQRA